MNFAQARAQLLQLTCAQIVPGLSRTQQLLTLTGDPDLAFPIVQITGTNGKGSVAVALSTVLQTARYRVGLFTSPHLADERERIRINGIPVSPRVFVQAFLRLKPGLHCLKRAQSIATIFEAWTVLAALIFKQQQVEMAVMEVGMGGRWDATTALRKKILTILTNVELEHTQILGKTKKEICREKLGIARPGIPLLSSEIDPKVREFMRRHASQNGYPLFFVGQGKSGSIRLRQWQRTRAGVQMALDIPGQGQRKLSTALSGAFQAKNISLAVLACLHLQQQGWHCPWTAILRGIKSLAWPGRLEQICAHPRIILDGAHNPAAMDALADEIRVWGGRQRVLLIIGVMRDKDSLGIIRALQGNVKKIWTMAPPGERGLAAEKLAQAFQHYGEEAVPARTMDEALRQAWKTAQRQDVILVTGSLYLLEPARRAAARFCQSRRREKQKSKKRT